MTTGFQIINQTLWIEKDPSATLTYTFDWSQWLVGTDIITAVTYELQVRANDPIPLVNVARGIVSGNKTYIKLSGGQVERNYIISCTVTTDSGLIDRRNFRVKVVNRSA